MRLHGYFCALRRVLGPAFLLAAFGAAAHAQCTYKIVDGFGNETVAVSVGYGAKSNQGGMYDAINVSTQTGCSWTASSNASWLHIVGGQQGVGSAPVNITIDQNNNTASRVGSVVLAGRVLTFTQEALLGPSALPVLFSISKNPGFQGSSCTTNNVPPITTAFQPTDPAAYLYFIMQDLNVGDQVTTRYFSPDGSHYAAADVIYPTSNIGISGGFFPECDPGALKIAGAPPANMGGNWKLDLLVNGVLVLEVPFTIAGSNTCSYSLSGNTNSFPGAGGNGTISVTANPGCAWNAVTTSTWIHIDSSGLSGVGSGTVKFNVDVNTGATRSGTIVIAQQSFTITQAGAGPAAPTITQGGVAEPWTNSTGLAPGAWVSLYGSNLSSLTNTWTVQANQGLPTSLAGVSVTIDGQPAPIAFVSPGQINVLVPANVHTGPVQIVVNNNGNVGPGLSIQSNTYLPAIYARPASGTSPVKYYVTAVDPVTFQIVGNFATDPNVQHAPRPGETIDLYALGLGPASQFNTSIAFTGAFPLNAPVTVTLGGTPLTPLFAGLVSPGLYQVRITIPSTMPAGDQLISLSVGGVAQSPLNVFLNIGQ